MDLNRIINEHTAVGLDILGFNQGVVAWSGTPSSEDLALSAALIDEHIEDTETYVKAKLDTACPTVYSLASGAQWDNLIQLQKDVKKGRVYTVSEDVDLTALLHRHLWAQNVNHTDKGDFEDEYYAAANAILSEYYPDE